MGTKQTYHRQSTKTDDCELVPLPQLPLTKKIETYLGSNQTPKVIIFRIISMLDPLSCLRLSMTSNLFPQFFTKHPIACLSSEKKLNPQLRRLYYEYCSQSLPLASVPQFLALKNSDQLVEYKKTMDPMHDDYLVIDFSKELNIGSIDILRTSSLLINWSNDYKSEEDAIKRSLDQFINFFQYQTFPNVKKLVLNNLVYSSRVINFLIGTFNKLKYLNIASYNTKSRFDIFLSQFTTINELEIMLPISSDFRSTLYFTMPIQLEKITFNGLQKNSKTISCKSKSNVRLIRPFQSTSLKTIIFKNDSCDDNLTTFSVKIPSCTEIFTSNTKGWTTLSCEFEDGCSHLIVIHVSEKDNYPFLEKSPDGKLSLTPDGKLILNEEMCPNCKEFGVFDKDGNLQIIWRKQ